MMVAENLDRLDLTPVRVHPDFRISDAVLNALDNVPCQVANMVGGDRLVCELCQQAFILMNRHGLPYRLTFGEIKAQLISHLMQRHGWTREMPGE